MEISLNETSDQIKRDIKRPTKLDITTLQSSRQKWEQCKVYGKNILIRSYAGACIIHSEFYVYGGLQIFNGILADFYKLNIRSQEKALQWEKVQSLKRMTLLVQEQSTVSLPMKTESSSLVVSNLQLRQTWVQLFPKGCEVPSLQTFGSALINKDHPKILLICGYNGKLCSSTNSIYSYDILENSIQTLFDHSNQRGICPSPRIGCGAVFNQKNKIYIFGGKSEEQEQRLHDFWEFDIEKNKYTQIQQNQLMKPMARSGHTMNFYEGKIFLFGGIHQITWQLDDLYIYDEKQKEWIVLETDSARKKKYQAENPRKIQKIKENNIEGESPQKKKLSFTATNHQLYVKKPNKAQLTQTNSPTKTTTNQLKHKAFLQKKAQMLRNFDVKQEQKQKILSLQFSSQAMKNSLDLIGNGLVSPDNPVKYKKSDAFKTSYSKFLQPLEITTHFIPGKKPCARDGHNAVLFENELVIFGGDRHHMSFNDMYILHLDSVINELPKY